MMEDSQDIGGLTARRLSAYWGSVTVLPDGRHVPHAEQEPIPGPIVNPRGYVGQRTLAAPGPHID